jgi:hypothetical protein
MDRSLLDRWTDTTAFRFALLLSGIAVLPILAVGALTTVIAGSVTLIQRSDVELEQALFGLVSVGGALGFIGYARAHWGRSNPARHNVTMTLLFLAAGVAAALAVAGYAVFGTLEGVAGAWGSQARWLTSLFAAANVVWAISGIAWLLRVPYRFAERTGRMFDTLPVMLLFVAIALTAAATLMTTTL